MLVELTGLDDVLKTLYPKPYIKALNRTVNDIGGKIKTQTTKNVRKTYNIKATDVKKHMNVRRSRYSDMKYVIDIRSSRFNAMRFNPKVLKKKGHISVRIRKDNGRKTLKRAFTANNGAVLQREKNSQKIRAVTTISVAQMFNKKILKEADEMARNEFGKKLQDNFSFYIGKV